MAKNTDKAVYYNANLGGKAFDVLKRNSDGTIDIGAGGQLVVKSCPVSSVPKEGHATLGAEPVEVKPEAPKQTAAEAAAAQVAVAGGE